MVAGVEIERKFLVSGDFRPFVRKSCRICQGYLSTDEERTVRVRVCDDKGYLTIKGKTDEKGMSRSEWEVEIPLEQAQVMLGLCRRVIDKTRHLVDAGAHTFEVDEFNGENAGLVVAEIELVSEEEEFEKPSWLGREVTGDVRYYNSMLLRNPYRNWKL